MFFNYTGRVVRVSMYILRYVASLRVCTIFSITKIEGNVEKIDYLLVGLNGDLKSMYVYIYILC